MYAPRRGRRRRGRSGAAPRYGRYRKKRPGGGAFRPHQDYPAFAVFGPDYHVTVMLSVDAATAENGCLQFAPGYREALRGHPEIDAGALAAGRATLPQNARGDIRDDLHASLDWEVVPTAPADLVMFDPAEIIDRASFEHPHREAAGVHTVLVNGVPVIRDGRPSGATPGRVLRHREAGIAT